MTLPFFSGIVTDTPAPPYMYIRAFSDGVNKTLDKYHEEIRQIELEILKDQHISIASILHKICHMFQPLECIAQVVIKVNINREIFFMY